jgi:hypothetical protein
MIVAAGKGRDVFGLFRGSSLFWLHLGRTNLPQEIIGIGAYSGATIYIGTFGGRLLAFDPSNGTHVELKVVTSLRGTRRTQAEVNQIILPSSRTGFATLNVPGQGFILKSTDLVTWTALASFPAGLGKVYGLEADWRRRPNEVYAATDDGVYVSRTAGKSWQKESAGLPAVPHSSDLRTSRGPSLYLSTFGRSVWRASLTPR